MNEHAGTQAAAPPRGGEAVDLETTTLSIVAVGVIAAALALCAFLAVLATGHLDEDAYILFTYSTNLASGHGIVWDLAHGHAEGATDFLWMLLISGLQRAGLDVGAAAALLNSLGLALSYFVIVRVAELRTVGLHILLAVSLLISHITAASLGGFSAHFYCAVFALASYLAVRREYPQLAFALLALGLVRPDGVILAAGILAAVSWYDPAAVLRSRLYFGTAAVLGLAYFAWRWWYFGLPLPLPLMVKSHTLSAIHGLRWNTFALLPLAGVLALIVWQRRALGSRLPIIAAGPVLLFAALSMANQMQNLAFRFQAPITLAVLMLGFCAARTRPALLCLALIPSLAFGVRGLDREIQPLIEHDYVNYFPQMLNSRLGAQAHVAVTEAGRFGFRLDASKLDIVGLDSPEMAVTADRAKALAAFQPDLVFLHQVWTLDTSHLDQQRNWVELMRDAYLALPVLDSPASDYHTDPTHLAALAARQFIASTTTPYFIYAVRYRGEYSHFYFLRSGGPVTKADFERALQGSFEAASVQPHCAYSTGFPCRLLAHGL